MLSKKIVLIKRPSLSGGSFCISEEILLAVICKTNQGYIQAREECCCGAAAHGERVLPAEYCGLSGTCPVFLPGIRYGNMQLKSNFEQVMKNTHILQENLLEYES